MCRWIHPVKSCKCKHLVFICFLLRGFLDLLAAEATSHGRRPAQSEAHRPGPSVPRAHTDAGPHVRHGPRSTPLYHAPLLVHRQPPAPDGQCELPVSGVVPIPSGARRHRTLCGGPLSIRALGPGRRLLSVDERQRINEHERRHVQRLELRVSARRAM